MRAEGRPLRFIAGRDTRESGEWIERELARGIRSEGAHITTAGVMPTPAVAYVAREMGYDAGIVISASHNPFQDNGIKVFSGRGEKFTEALERQVEAIIADPSWSVGGSADDPVERTDVIDAYIAHARLALPGPAAARPPQDRHRHRQRRDDDGGAAAVRGAGLRRAPDRCVARRPQHQPRLRLHASRGAGSARWSSRGAASASRSTATATAPSWSTPPAASSTATPCC